jgi:hypothetical protein
MPFTWHNDCGGGNQDGQGHAHPPSHDQGGHESYASMLVRCRNKYTQAKQDVHIRNVMAPHTIARGVNKVMFPLKVLFKSST